MWAVGVILYFALKGVPAFQAASQDELFRRIEHGEYDNCEGGDWGAVSDAAKSLIRGLLELTYRKRLSAKRVLAHAFIADPV